MNYEIALSEDWCIFPHLGNLFLRKSHFLGLSLSKTPPTATEDAFGGACAAPIFRVIAGAQQPAGIDA